MQRPFFAGFGDFGRGPGFGDFGAGSDRPLPPVQGNEVQLRPGAIAGCGFESYGERLGVGGEGQAAKRVGIAATPAALFAPACASASFGGLK